ncbi:hypothetical protein B6C97_11505, partial [Gilliamella apis]
IKEYDFYSPEQIFILEKENYTNISEFLQTDFLPIPLEILYQYSADEMLKTINSAFITSN